MSIQTQIDEARNVKAMYRWMKEDALTLQPHELNKITLVTDWALYSDVVEDPDEVIDNECHPAWTIATLVIEDFAEDEGKGERIFVVFPDSGG